MIRYLHRDLGPFSLIILPGAEDQFAIEVSGWDGCSSGDGVESAFLMYAADDAHQLLFARGFVALDLDFQLHGDGVVKGTGKQGSILVLLTLTQAVFAQLIVFGGFFAL